MIKGLPKLVCAPISLTKEVQTVGNFREIQIIESSQNGMGWKGPWTYPVPPLPCQGQGILWLDQVAQSLTQADVEYFQDGACTTRRSKAVTDNNKILVL